MRPPRLNALRTFDAAARHLNFRLAAEELNLTQGAIAQQVRKLETDLETRLFNRIARGLALTDSGRAYHRSIRRALHIIDEATRALGPESARVTISVTPSFASRWLVPRLAKFSSEHPDVDIQTIASEQLANFKTDQVDIAVRQGATRFDDALCYEYLTDLTLCAVCSPEYARGVGSVSCLADLRRYQLIQDGHSLWEKLLGDAQLPLPTKTLKFSHTALALDAAENGQGIALAPRLILTSALGNRKLKLLWQDSRCNQEKFHLVYPREPGGSTTSRDRVIDWLKAEVNREQD